MRGFVLLFALRGMRQFLRVHVATASLLLVVGAFERTANALPGDHNRAPEICQGVNGTAFLANVLLGFAIPSPNDFYPSLGSFAANLALRLCPPQIVAPPDKTGADGFLPDAMDATSSDPEVDNPAVNDPNCYASIPQFITQQQYSNILGVEPWPLDNWGTLGTPKVFHFNTSVDVRLFAGTPPDDPSTDGDESLLDAWQTTRTENGWPAVKLPVGAYSLSYRADSLASALDFAFIYIPKIPAASKPYAELVKESGKLTAILVKTLAAAREISRIIKTPLGAYPINELLGRNLRHSQFGGTDVFNTDRQRIWVLDVIPPVLTSRTDVTTLPERVQAVLSYDAVEGVHYLEAIHPGGIRSGTGITMLRGLLDYHDHCNRHVSLRHNGGGARFWPTGSRVNLVWTATDPGPRDRTTSEGNSVSLTQVVEVRDSFPPILLAPPSRVVEVPAGETDTIIDDLGAPRVFDLADLTPEVANDADSTTFDLGLTEVTWTASDGVNTSEAVQLINVKVEGTNSTPVAIPQTVDTRSFVETEIILSGSDADYHPSVDRYDPLTFSIVEPPANGSFVAPLLPYFIDDFRLEASALRFKDDLKNADPRAYCRDPNADPKIWHAGYPHTPEWMAVNDGGDVMVFDRGLVRCTPGRGVQWSERLVVFDANQDIKAFRELSSRGEPSDVYWNARTDRIYITRIYNDGDDSVEVFASDLGQSTRYNLGTGGSSEWQTDRPRSVAVDSRGIMYVATNGFVNAFRQVDGTTYVEGSDVFLGRAWQDFEHSGIRSIATDSNDNLYVGYDDRIVKVSRARVFDNDGFEPGQLVGWLGRCSANRTNTYACDVRNERSLGFACTHDICAREDIGGAQPGQFRGAQGIAVDPNDVLYVADSGNRRVQRFTSDGAFGGEAKSTGVGFGFLLGDFGVPQDIEVNSNNFYILNREADLLHIFKVTPITPHRRQPRECHLSVE